MHCRRSSELKLEGACPFALFATATPQSASSEFFTQRHRQREQRETTAMRVIHAVWTTVLMAAAAHAELPTPPRVEDIGTPLTRVAFGSCNDQSFDQPLWPAIGRHQPDMWVWMGDNIYADMPERETPRLTWPPPKLFVEATESELRRRYARQLSNANYSAFASKTPMIGIWDDHDFGINDGHKGFTHRVDSQQVFLDFMNEPVDSPRRKQEGVYASYVVGSGEKTVKFILIDNRYHRDDYKTQGGDFLGETQWKWLEEQLTDSTAAFNVIVSGIQILPADRFFNAESWSRFPPQRERLLQVILGSKAKGVILLSGDVHFGEINQVVCSGGDNVITEMTSSGLTHSWMQFHAPQIRFFPALLFTLANLILPWEFRPQHSNYYGSLNWGMLDFDWDSKPHPVAHVRVRGEDDQVKLDFEVASKAIFSSSPAEDSLACKPPREISNLRRRTWQVILCATLALMIVSMLFNVVVLVWLVWFVLAKLFGRGDTKTQATQVKKTN